MITLASTKLASARIQSLNDTDTNNNHDTARHNHTNHQLHRIIPDQATKLHRIHHNREARLEPMALSQDC